MSLPKPLAIAVTVVEYNKRVLMIRRQKQPYAGYWSIPGGKIEVHEDIRHSALREIKEESGLDCEFVRYAGLVSEHLIKEGEVKAHFLLHLCVLKADTDEVVESEEGPLQWFSFEELRNNPEVIPSDLLMLEELVYHPTRNYFHCVLTETNDQLELTEVEL